MPGDPLIQLEGTSKRFGHRPGVLAVQDISLSVSAGEVCAVVGANGAGKSTLLALVLGFLRPTAGTVRVAGEPPRERHRDGGVGYLPERFTLPARWTVRQALGGLAALERAAAPDARVEAALGEWGLEAVAERAVAELSRGTLQRVGLAQAWLAPAALLVLDEPTEGLDPLWRLHLRDRIAERRAAGTAVLVASHDLAEIERVADRVVILEQGRVREVVAGRPAAGAGGYRLQLARGGEHVLTVFPGAAADGDAWRVEVADAHELTARVAALIELGGVLTALQPLGLEDRIRSTYEVTP